MKLVLALLFCLPTWAQFMPFPGPGLPAGAPPAGITLVNSGKAGGAAGATTAGINMTGANFLVMTVSSSSVTGLVVSDSLNGTTGWTKLSPSGTGPTSVLYYNENPIVGSAQTFSASGNGFHGICVMGFAGLAVSGVFEAGTNHGNTTTATTNAPGTVTPGTGNQLIVTGCADSDGTAVLSVDSGFSSPVRIPFSGGVNYSASISYLIQPSGATVNPTWTSTNLIAGFACTDAAFQGQ